MAAQQLSGKAEGVIELVKCATYDLRARMGSMIAGFRSLREECLGAG